MDKGLASGNKEPKGLDLFHTGNVNLPQAAGRGGLSPYLSDFLLLGATSEEPKSSHDENLMMMMYTCSVCRGKTLTSTQRNTRFDIGSVRKAGGAVASPLNYLGTAEINTPVGVESAPCSNGKITKITMGINVEICSRCGIFKG